MDNPEQLRCISLCTVYAGLELGLKRAWPNVRTVAYVEIEAFAVANLVSKMEAGKLDVAPVWTDVKTFDGSPFRKRVHIVTAGYPCQPFSVAGKRKGTKDSRHLWPHIARIIEAVRPVWFIGENVPGHLSIGFPEVYRNLRNMGYSVEAGLFTAAEVGAPHKRQRLFILSYASNGGRGQLFQQKQKCRSSNTADFGGNGKIQHLADAEQQLRNGIRTARTGGRNEYSDCRWPARPGQTQYEWEEPRVVVENSSKRRRIQQKTSEKRREDRRSIDASGQGQAQSSVGRAVDGTSCRVDRMRLLGNGVIRQQAEKAIRMLTTLFE